MGSYTPNFNLYKPDIDETGWGDKVNQNFDIIDEELTANKTLEKLKTVDGAGSGLDADLLDGKHASDFVPVSSDSDINISISGTQVLNINTAGILTLPKQSACYAYLSSNQSISANVVTKINLDATLFDTQNEFDATNHRITVSKNGKYLIIGSININAETSGNILFNIIERNGVQVGISKLTAAANVSHIFNVVTVLELEAGDYIELFAKNTNNDTTIFAGSDVTYLCVIKIT